MTDAPWRRRSRQRARRTTGLSARRGGDVAHPLARPGHARARRRRRAACRARAATRSRSTSDVWTYGVADGNWQQSAVTMVAVAADRRRADRRSSAPTSGTSATTASSRSPPPSSRASAPRSSTDLPLGGWRSSLLFLLAGAVGAAWTFVPAVLKARYGTNEIITTLMMTFIGVDLADYPDQGAVPGPCGARRRRRSAIDRRQAAAGHPRHDGSTSACSSPSGRRRRALPADPNGSSGCGCTILGRRTPGPPATSASTLPRLIDRRASSSAVRSSALAAAAWHPQPLLGLRARRPESRPSATRSSPSSSSRVSTRSPSSRSSPSTRCSRPAATSPTSGEPADRLPARARRADPAVHDGDRVPRPQARARRELRHVRPQAVTAVAAPQAGALTTLVASEVVTQLFWTSVVAGGLLAGAAADVHGARRDDLRAGRRAQHRARGDDAGRRLRRLPRRLLRAHGVARLPGRDRSPG